MCMGELKYTGSSKVISQLIIVPETRCDVVLLMVIISNVEFYSTAWDSEDIPSCSSLWPSLVADLMPTPYTFVLLCCGRLSSPIYMLCNLGVSLSFKRSDYWALRYISFGHWTDLKTGAVVSELCCGHMLSTDLCEPSPGGSIFVYLGGCSVCKRLEFKSFNGVLHLYASYFQEYRLDCIVASCVTDYEVLFTLSVIYHIDSGHKYEVFGKNHKHRTRQQVY